MTFNIFAGNDLDRQSNLARVAALIDSVGADVVFMQEVDRRTARSGGVDQPGELARLTGLPVEFGASMSFDGGEFGNAVLTRYPVTSRRLVRYTRSDSVTEPRSLLHLVVTTGAGPLHLIATHVDHRPNSAARAGQLRELEQYIARNVAAGGRLVVGGDLNARPDAPELAGLLQRLTDAWAACGAGDGHTFRSDAPDRRIDYILLGGVGCTHARVHATRTSDHRPVIVHIELPPGG